LSVVTESLDKGTRNPSVRTSDPGAKRAPLLKLFALACAFLSNTALGAEYVLAAMPMGTESEQKRIYDPIANYLSQVTGEKFRYVYIRHWPAYRRALFEDRYDIYFNGPHLSSFLVQHKEHQYITRLREPLSFVVIARKDDEAIAALPDFTGRQACLHLEPSLETVLFLHQFKNPSRQPAMRVIQGWDTAFNDVVQRKCSGAVVPYNVFEKLNEKKLLAAILLLDNLPNQAFTSSRKVPPEIVGKIRAAMLQEKRSPAFDHLLSVNASNGFTNVNPEQYKPLVSILYTDYFFGNEISRGNGKKD
jgi:ABC-type phosphate/phosphonate transport system substrate-binding protein